MAEAPTTATIVFTDLVASTALRARLGEEQADELRRIHDELLTARVQAHGGRVVRPQGDGLMAAFPSASDAVSAAVEMQQAIDRYNRTPKALAELSMRVGLSTGDVSWEGGDCFGTPVVEAARLEAAAEGGQILCSDFVRMMARGRGGHEFSDLGFLELKGMPEPVATCEVIWAPLVGPEPGLPLPPELALETAHPFVSRTTELELAEAVVGDPTRERAAVLWLLGEPGIGKTRLATEIARRAQGNDALVLFGRCNEDLSVPYQPFLEALRWFVSRLPDDELARRLGDSPGELTRLLPELRARLPGLEPSRSTSAEIEQHRLFEAVRSWLAAAGGERPVLAVLDDVHWAARPTLSLLGHVARRAEPSRAVLVCTARTTSPDDNEALAALAEELDRRGVPGHRLELSGLEVDAVGELVSSAAGRSLDDRLRALAARLHGETAGNPLFVDALLASPPPDQAWHPDDLPRSLAETVRRRVSRLPSDVQDLLRTASVVGLDFDLRVAARATGCDEPAALEALEEAARAGLIEETGPNRYRFAHALVRSVLREELSATRRVRVHLGVGEALETVHGQHREEHAGELAHHFSEAVAAGGASRAYHYSVLAAERATRLLSHHEAADAYGRALELLDEGDADEPLTRCELLLARGEAQRKAADFRSAQATLRAAAEEAVARGVPEHLARAAIAHEDSGWRPGYSGAESVELLERAGAALPVEESPLRALTTAGLSRALLFSGRHTEAIERAKEAEAMARGLDRPVTTAAVLARSSFTYLNIEHAPTMAARAAEQLALARRLGDDDLYVTTLIFALHASAVLGDLTAYDQFLDEFARLVDQIRQPFKEHVLQMCRHARAFLAGDLVLAEHLLEEVRELSQEQEWAPEGLYGVNMFLLRREQGRLAGLAPTLRTLVRLNPQTAMWRPGLVALYAELGMLEEARTEFECLAADDFAAIPLDATRPFCLSLLAEVCSVLGDADRASWLLDWLRSLEGRLLVFPGIVGCLGPADRLSGMLASVAGRPAEAERFLEQSLELSRRIDSPVWVAHCLYDFARLLSSSDPWRVRSMLAEAAELCERYGLVALGQRVAASRTQQNQR